MLLLSDEIKTFLGEDLVSELVQKKNEIKPTEVVSGYVALAIKPEAVEKIKEAGTAELELPGLYDKADSYRKTDALVEPKKETIALSNEGEQKKSPILNFTKIKLRRKTWERRQC